MTHDKINVMKQIIKSIFEFRPIDDGRKYLRYNKGKWTEDDGEWDLAFITNDPGTPMAYYVSLPYRENILWKWVTDGRWGASVFNHPNGNAWHYMSVDGTRDIQSSFKGRDAHENEKVGRLAMDKLCSINGCANGRGPEFGIGDPYIVRGLLRDRKTKRVIKFPKTFNCIYCGSHDLTKINIEKQHA